MFSAPMVRAILAGTKTVTRRVVRLKNGDRLGTYRHDADPRAVDFVLLDQDGDPVDEPVRCPYGAPGDRLWVRETWGLHGYGDYTYWHRDSVRGRTEDDLRGSWEVAYAADALSPYDHWRPSIYMPRWASRITLEVVDVRVERLHEITEEDARAEGVAYRDTPDGRHGGWDAGDGVLHNAPTHAYRALWERINGAGSWARNDWVWRVEFRRLQ